MSEETALEQKIAFLKIIYTALLGISMGLAGYIVNHLDSDLILVVISGFLLTISLYATMELGSYILKLINQLKDFGND